MNFDWRTDEDDKQWEQEPSLPIIDRRRRWRRLTILAVFMALAFVSCVIYRQLGRKVEQVTNTAEQELLDSYHLLRQAAVQQDRELLFLVLSGRDPAWTNSQRDLMVLNLLFDRQPLGLQALPDASQVISVSVSSELTSAELVFEQSYAVAADDGLTETVRLQQTAVFRRNQDRWLFAPPRGDFWGSWATLENQQLRLVFPRRDETIARRLAADLEETVAEACALVNQSEVTCPHITLRLETNPAALLATADLAWTLQNGRLITLPTPSLVGLPVDEAGYQAVRRSYTLPVVARLLNEAAGWQCCDHLYFYQAMLDWQLAELGLRSWPVTSAAYEVMIDRPLRYSELANFWPLSDPATLNEEERRQVYALVEFALQRSPKTSALLEQRRLPGAASLMNWMIPLFGGFQDDILIAGEWQLFAYQRSLSAQRPPPIPLPDEEITLMCASHPETPTDNLFDLYRYHLAADSYARTLLLRPITFIVGLPNQADLLMIQEEERNGEGWRQFRLYRGGLIYEQPLDGESNWFFEGSNPNGRQLILSHAERGGGMWHFALLDQEGCNLDGCSLQELPGYPVWSPDGTQMLASGLDKDTYDLIIWYGDEQARYPLQLGEGHSPFWLDNESFGYIQLDLEADLVSPGVTLQPVIIKHIGNDSPQLLFTNESLRVTVPAETRPEGLSLNGIFPIPDGSGRLLVRAHELSAVIQARGTFFFRVDPQTKDISWLLRRDELLPGNAAFSPDGRWLVMRGTQQPGLDRMLYLYHPDQNRILSLYLELESSSGWSADGQWFWSVQSDLLYLLAPDHDYRLLRPLPLAGCRMATSSSAARLP